MANETGPNMRDLYDEVNAVHESIKIYKHTRSLIPIFTPLSEEERRRELFKRKLKGEIIDTEYLKELLQDSNT